MEVFTTREQIVEVVNRLFVYTDEQEWENLENEVFSREVLFDMSSLGTPAKKMPAKEICANWKQGFEGLDAVNHLAGNYLVTLNDDAAIVFAYATATHFKKSASRGATRDFVGTYDLHLAKTEIGWRIDAFRYNLKYITGNVNLE